MALTLHNPDDPTPYPELSDTLRSAVEMVCQARPPAVAVDRAMTRARGIGKPRPGLWSGRGIQLFATAAAASTLLFILGLRYGAYHPVHYLSRTLPDKPKEIATAAVQWDLPPEADDALLVGDPDRVAISPRAITEDDAGDVQLVGLGHLGSHWDEWDRAQALRGLSRDMPPVDRKAIEGYIRHLPPPTHRQPADLRVIVRWNVEATVVLTMIAPDGTRQDSPPLCATGKGRMCYWQIRDASPGDYEVQVGLNDATTRSAGDVIVNVEIIRYAATACEAVYQQNVLLRKGGKRVRVARVEY